MSRRVFAPDTTADAQLRHVLADTELRGFTVIAGAGSGKTTSLVKALAHVIATRGGDFRARGQKIACITYTEIAVREILNELSHNPVVHVSTIHSYLWNLIKPFQHDIRCWTREWLQTRLEETLAEQASFSSRVQQGRRDSTDAKIRQLINALSMIESVKKFTYGTGSNYAKGVLGHEDVINLVPSLIISRPLLAQLVARRYPVVFVDESQDTFPNVVECLRHVARQDGIQFCVGFFGDPMQKIYVRGVGSILPDDGWKEVKKPENFRSPRRVLDVINAIRADADGLHQVSGLPSEKQMLGEVSFFVLPADAARTRSLEMTQKWLRANSGIGAWEESIGVARTKILVISHRMAARRLGFEGLYDAFHESVTLRDAFDEGHAWPLTPFLSTLVPLANASVGDRSRLVPLLRGSSPLLRNVSGVNVRAVLSELHSGVDEVHKIMSADGPGSVGKVLRAAQRYQIIDLDKRLSGMLANSHGHSVEESTMTTDVVAAIRGFLDCDAQEIFRYSKYIDRESPYSTHQGVKGAEYSDVLVVLDDEEGRHNQFSYDKLLGIKHESRRDRENELAGKETIVERTRRLLYVCASRATRALAIVIFASDVEAAAGALRKSNMPGAELVRGINDFSPITP